MWYPCGKFFAEGMAMTQDELIERLQKLERDNRRMKKLGVAALVLAAALGVMAATRPVPDVVTSHKFVLLDRHGRARVTISTPAFAGAAVGMDADETAIWISDDKGADRAILTADGLLFADSREKPLASYGNQKITAREFDVVNNSRDVLVRLASADNSIPFVSLYGSAQSRMTLSVGGMSSPNPSVAVEGGPWIAFGDSHGKAELSMGIQGDEPTLNLTDRRGFGLVLGSTGTVALAAGETQKTSAASIIMFGNDKKRHVIWQAP